MFWRVQDASNALEYLMKGGTSIHKSVWAHLGGLLVSWSGDNQV